MAVKGVGVSLLASDWRLQIAMVSSIAFPVLMASLLSWYGIEQRTEPFNPILLREEVVNSTAQVESLFSQYDYHWPPAETVPAVAIETLPPSMHKLSIAQRKSLFFRILFPLVVAENRRIEIERQWLKRLQAGQVRLDMPRLRALASNYRLSPDTPVEQLIDRLLYRVDIVPPGLVLAQAANESGWGTSRFSRQVNNLFGEWTYKAEHGILPARRPEGASHYIRRFDSLRGSVRSYLHNLNIGRAYTRFRAIRASMRSADKPLDSVVLAEGLYLYSARGSAYVREIQALVRSNELNNLGQPDLVR